MSEPWIDAVLCHCASLRLDARPTCIGNCRDPATTSPRTRLACAVPAQIHLTQGATPADMYISWATGNAVYTYCSESDGATCGDKTNACECNQTAPTMTSSQVQLYSEIYIRCLSAL